MIQPVAGRDVVLVGHGSHSNYNAMIVTWQKQTGPITFTANYTFSKVLGIRDNQTDNSAGQGNTVYPFDLRANYVLQFDRSHIFNAAHVVNLPNAIRNGGNKFAGGVLNGWQLSGITQVQSGGPIQPSTNGTLNVNWPDAYNEQQRLGSNALNLAVVPRLVCDPRSGLQSGQYSNPGLLCAAG